RRGRCPSPAGRRPTSSARCLPPRPTGAAFRTPRTRPPASAGRTRCPAPCRRWSPWRCRRRWRRWSAGRAAAGSLDDLLELGFHILDGLRDRLQRAVAGRDGLRALIVAAALVVVAHRAGHLASWITQPLVVD